MCARMHARMHAHCYSCGHACDVQSYNREYYLITLSPYSLRQGISGKLRPYLSSTFALRNLRFSLLNSGKTNSCCTCLAFPECVNLHAGRHVCMAKSASTHISNPLLKALKQESETEISKEIFLTMNCM